MTQNEQRAENAYRIWLQYKRYESNRPEKDPAYSDEFEEFVTDILTDILHLSKDYGGIDLQNLARIAGDHYEAEVAEETK